MNPKILLFVGMMVALASSLCAYDDYACQQTVTGKTNINNGISSNGQGISAGKNVNSNGGVNVNGNNGAGILAKDRSVISSVNRGKTNVNTGAKSAITTSGRGGSSTQNSGVISSKKGRGHGLLNSGYVALDNYGGLQSIPVARAPAVVVTNRRTVGSAIAPTQTLVRQAVPTFTTNLYGDVIPTVGVAQAVVPGVEQNNFAQ